MTLPSIIRGYVQFVDVEKSRPIIGIRDARRRRVSDITALAGDSVSEAKV